MISRSNARDTILPLAVILVGLNIGFYWLRAEVYQRKQLVENVQSERNERSTPRSFILPATPAVAYEQEARARKDSAVAKVESQLALCAVRLVDLGYDVGDEAVMFNAKLAAAIFQYQESEGMHATGRLDAATISRLSCKGR